MSAPRTQPRVAARRQRPSHKHLLEPTRLGVLTDCAMTAAAGRRRAAAAEPRGWMAGGCGPEGRTAGQPRQPHDAVDGRPLAQHASPRHQPPPRDCRRLAPLLPRVLPQGQPARGRRSVPGVRAAGRGAAAAAAGDGADAAGYPPQVPAPTAGRSERAVPCRPGSAADGALGDVLAGRA